VSKSILAFLVAAVLAAGYAAYTAQIEVYFSPNGGCRDAIATQLRAARRSIDVAIYSFTVNSLASILDSAARRGVKGRVVTDREQAASGPSVAATLAKKLPLRIGAGGGYMHNKFAVVDDSLCITGSYNWSESAELKNDENLLVIACPELARAYKARFEILWTYSMPESCVVSQPAYQQPSSPPASTAVHVVKSSGAGKTQSDGGETVFITRTGKKYHRAGCSSLSKSCIPISRKDAEARGYTPCSRCRP